MGRYLLAASALAGHVLPMVEIGRHLVHGGHEAVMLTGPRFAGLVGSVGMRARDHPTDNRVVHLRYTDQGKATGLAFFGSLGERTHAILDGFTSSELQVIARFIATMADSAREHVRELEGRLPGSWSSRQRRARENALAGHRARWPRSW